MKKNEMKRIYIDYFVNNGHKEIKNSSLIPDNDPSALYTMAGMHPLTPYLLGEEHPLGQRLVNVQKCIRTCDIEEVGDDCHVTLLEMLGNWSLGDYFKEKSIEFSFKFLVDILGIPVERLAVTVFEGDANFPKDSESYNAWLSLGIKKENIYSYGKKENWWGLGYGGPCGTDTEIFYDNFKPKCSNECGPACSCGKYVEIWNNVFMEYNQVGDNSYESLSQKNVDTGMGFERIYAIVNNKSNLYETDLFSDAIKKLELLSGKNYEDNLKGFRIIVDHIRAAVFILGDENLVVPSNTEQGYILRRLIRRSLRFLKKIECSEDSIVILSKVTIDNYKDEYPLLEIKRDFIVKSLEEESRLFNKTLTKGLKEFNKMTLDCNGYLDSSLSFKLYDTFGFPIEMTMELCMENNITVSIEEFNKRFEEHQDKSRLGAEKKFSGGMGNNDLNTIKLHTATHLLQQALRQVLGRDICQKGSNITSERLRFDFSFDRKLTEEEIFRVESLVNNQINLKLDINYENMTVSEAMEKGAIGLFGDKYEDIIKVYSIGDFSCEICGGPHVNNTSELGKFKIIKEESSSSGVRRIKAILE